MLAYCRISNSYLGKFCMVLHWKSLSLFIYGHFVLFVSIWYIVWLFGIFPPKKSGIHSNDVSKKGIYTNGIYKNGIFTNGTSTNELITFVQLTS
jgi:hypothetical protein